MSESRYDKLSADLLQCVDDQIETEFQKLSLEEKLLFLLRLATLAGRTGAAIFQLTTDLVGDVKRMKNLSIEMEETVNMQRKLDEHIKTAEKLHKRLDPN